MRREQQIEFRHGVALDLISSLRAFGEKMPLVLTLLREASERIDKVEAPHAAAKKAKKERSTRPPRHPTGRSLCKKEKKSIAGMDFLC